jgi:hypothetical protein
VHHDGRASRLLFLEKVFNPRNTQMNANRKEFLLYFAFRMYFVRKDLSIGMDSCGSWATKS